MIGLVHPLCRRDAGLDHLVVRHRRERPGRIVVRGAIIPAGGVEDLDIALFDVILERAAGADADKVFDAAAGQLFPAWQLDGQPMPVLVQEVGTPLYTAGIGDSSAVVGTKGLIPEAGDDGHRLGSPGSRT